MKKLECIGLIGILFYLFCKRVRLRLIIPSLFEIFLIYGCIWIRNIRIVRLFGRRVILFFVGVGWMVQFYLKLFCICNPTTMTILSGYCFYYLLFPREVIIVREEEEEGIFSSFPQEIIRWTLLRITNVILTSNISLLIKIILSFFLFTLQENSLNTSIKYSVLSQFTLATVIKICLLRNGMLAHLFPLHCLELLLLLPFYKNQTELLY